MVLSKFKDLIKNHLEFEDLVDSLSIILNYDNPIVEYSEDLFNQLLQKDFDKEDIDTIYWWMYELGDKSKPSMWDKDGNVIPMESIEDLWNFINNNK